MSFRSGALAFLALCLLTIAGCDLLQPRTVSPFSGQKVTADQLQVEALRADAERKAVDAREQAQTKAKLRRLQSAAELKAHELTSTNELELARLKAQTDTEIADAIETLTANQRARDDTAAAMRAQFDAAAADLNQQAQARAASWQAIISNPLVQSIPGVAAGTSLLSPLLTAAGVFSTGTAVALGRRQKKRAAKAESELAATLKGAERVVDSIDLLKRISPEVELAFKKHKAEILEWQGRLGSDLVQALQRADPSTAPAAASGSTTSAIAVPKAA